MIATKTTRRRGMDPRTLRLDPDAGRFRMVTPIALDWHEARDKAAPSAAQATKPVATAERLVTPDMAEYRTPEAIAERARKRTEREIALTSRTTRSVCVRCAVRDDVHDQFGCRRFVTL